MHATWAWCMGMHATWAWRMGASQRTQRMNMRAYTYVHTQVWYTCLHTQASEHRHVHARAYFILHAHTTHCLHACITCTCTAPFTCSHGLCMPMHTQAARGINHLQSARCCRCRYHNHLLILCHLLLLRCCCPQSLRYRLPPPGVPCTRDCRDSVPISGTPPLVIFRCD